MFYLHETTITIIVGIILAIITDDNDHKCIIKTKTMEVKNKINLSI